MKIKQSVLMLSLALLSFSSAIYAQAEIGEREFVLSGAGTSPSGFESTDAEVVLEYGQFTSRAMEFGIRQHVSFSEDDDIAFRGATFLFGDYHFDHGAWQPFVGGSLGVRYGEDVDEAFYVGPETGIKYYVYDTTFITGRVAYLFNIENEADEGTFFYTLGIGYNF